MPDPSPTPKRVVLRYLTGRFADMDRIIGLDDGTTTLPELLEDLALLELEYPAGLSKVTPRYALYNEIARPDVPAFHAEQR